MSEEYRDGYKDGFKEGYEFGKKAATPPSNPYTTIPNEGWKPDWLRQKGSGTTCQVCGMFFEHGKAYGYVCPNLRCPSKATCVTPLTVGVAPGSSVSTTSATISATPASWLTSSAAGKPLTDNGQWSSWMSGRPTNITLNNTPDGLSYEEIYGSVVYQQNKKKE